MKLECADTPSGGTELVLPEVLDLRSAAPLKAALCEALNSDIPLTVDAGRVERLSTACVQVLIAFSHAASQAGRQPLLRQPTDAFIRAFETLGLQQAVSNWRTEARPCAS